MRSLYHQPVLVEENVNGIDVTELFLVVSSVDVAIVEFEDDWANVYKILSFNNLISLNILEIMLLNKVRGLDFITTKAR